MKFAKSLIAAGLLASASAANAAIIEIDLGSQSIGPLGTDWTTIGGADAAPLQFQNFNESLGTLTGVRITMSGSWAGFLDITNRVNPPGGGTNTQDTTLNSASLTVDMGFDVFNDGTDDATDSDTGNWTAPALPITLAPGEDAISNEISGGLAALLNINTNLDLFSSADGTGTWDFGCNADSDDDTSASGGAPAAGHTATASCTVQVQYFYDDGKVPTPAPLALLALGALGFAASRRRKA